MEPEFRSVMRQLEAHPNDMKMQLRFALGLYAGNKQKKDLDLTEFSFSHTIVMRIQP